MKTAVEWLIEQIKSDQYQKALSLSEWMKVFEQAKEMEKEQMFGSHAQHSFRIEMSHPVIGDGSVNYPIIPNRPNRTN